MTAAERAAKIVQFLKPPEGVLQGQLDEVRKERRRVLQGDKDADVRDLVLIERVLRDVLVNLTSGRAQLEEVR